MTHGHLLLRNSQNFESTSSWSSIWLKCLAWLSPEKNPACFKIKRNMLLFVWNFLIFLLFWWSMFAWRYPKFYLVLSYLNYIKPRENSFADQEAGLDRSSPSGGLAALWKPREERPTVASPSILGLGILPITSLRDNQDSAVLARKHSNFDHIPVLSPDGSGSL